MNFFLFCFFFYNRIVRFLCLSTIGECYFECFFSLNSPIMKLIIIVSLFTAKLLFLFLTFKLVVLFEDIFCYIFIFNYNFETKQTDKATH